MRGRPVNRRLSLRRFESSSSHHRPTKGVLRTEAPTSQNSSPSESDEVDAGERMVDLLHRASCRQAAEVDRGEPRVFEDRDDIRFRVGIVPGDEDHPPAAGRRPYADPSRACRRQVCCRLSRHVRRGRGRRRARSMFSLGGRRRPSRWSRRRRPDRSTRGLARPRAGDPRARRRRRCRPKPPRPPCLPRLRCREPRPLTRATPGRGCWRSRGGDRRAARSAPSLARGVQRR